MTCGSIQKDIATACADEIVNAIKVELGDDLFAILVDESRDVSCKEQMALVLRFANREEEVVERLVGVKKVEDTSGLALKNYVCEMLGKLKLSHTKIRGQGYDGASNMSGAFNGLRTLIQNDAPSAYFVHCFVHQLQLALVFVAKNHGKINDFFLTITRLLNLIGSSYKRRDKLREKQATNIVASLAQGDIESGKGMNQEYGVKRPCDTKWGSHYGSLLNIKKIYSSICEVLQDLGVDSSDQDDRSEALRVLRKIKTFDFVFCLHLMVDILGETDGLNKTLQKKDQQIVNAMHQVRTSKERLQDMGNGGWEPLIQKVTLFSEKYDCERIDMNGAYFDGISRRIGSKVNNLHHYQVEVLYLVIDMQLQELNHRFNEVNTRLLICMSSLCPSKSFKAFKVDDLIELATFYLEEFPTPYDSLELELRRYIVDVSGDKEFATSKDIKDLCKKMVETKKNEEYTQMYIFSSN